MYYCYVEYLVSMEMYVSNNSQYSTVNREHPPVKCLV